MNKENRKKNSISSFTIHDDILKDIIIDMDYKGFNNCSDISIKVNGKNLPLPTYVKNFKDALLYIDNYKNMIKTKSLQEYDVDIFEDLYDIENQIEDAQNNIETALSSVKTNDLVAYNRVHNPNYVSKATSLDITRLQLPGAKLNRVENKKKYSLAEYSTGKGTEFYIEHAKNGKAILGLKNENASISLKSADIYEAVDLLQDIISERIDAFDATKTVFKTIKAINKNQFYDISFRS